MRYTHLTVFREETSIIQRNPAKRRSTSITQFCEVLRYPGGTQKSAGARKPYGLVRFRGIKEEPREAPEHINYIVL